jgi:3D (Asp-Asp-Asp) domain-containing protein
MVAIALTIFTGTVSAYSAQTKSINYTEYNVEENYASEASTIGEFFEEQNIEVGEEDKVYVNDALVTDFERSISNGDDVYIKRAYDIEVIIDGVKYTHTVTGGKVSDVADSYAEELGETYEVINCSESTNLKRNMTIEFETTEDTVETVTQEIPFETEYVENPDLLEGTENVIQEGKNGVKQYTYYKTFVGGELDEISETSEVISEPVNEIIEKGTKKEPQNIVDGYEYSSKLTMTSTAYTAYCSGVKSRTATGAEAVKGVVAVDTSVIPLGTELYISGYGYAVAADTGGAIKGNKIDLCMNSYDEAIQWGRRTVEVYILK